MIGNSTSLTAAQAERLLDASQHPAHGTDPLVRVLAAASAPGRADEITGEDEALRAFRLARRGAPILSPAVTATVARRRMRWTWALVAKFVAVVLAATGAGWALAATTGVVPIPFQDSPPTVPGPGESRPGSGPATSGESGQPWVSPSDGASPSAEASGEPTGSAGATPSAEPGTPSAMMNVRGLCRAYISTGEDPEDLTPANGFGKLVAAAGGVENVSTFCRDLLDLDPPGRAPGPSPSPSAILGASPTPTPSA